MARSEYIYLVMDGPSHEETPCAAFTVKHEMLTWIRRQLAENSFYDWKEAYILRMRDGVNKDIREEFDITDEVRLLVEA